MLALPLRKLYAIGSCVLLQAGIYAQQIGNVDEAVLSNTDRTYVSFSQGLGSYKTPYGMKRLNPLIFEGQISPDFFLNLSKNSSMGLAFFPKIVVRMYDEPSVPVKTPSYMPSILFYHRINLPFATKITNRFKALNRLAFMTYRIVHHSNGQDGGYYKPGTDTVNYINGNFSTNGAEIALSWCAVDSTAKGKFFINARLAYEHQVNFEREPLLKNTYYYDKASLEAHFIYSEKVKLYATYAFMWGTRQFGSRQSLDVFLVVKPFHHLSDFSVFARGYVGPDYYNIYFVNQLRAITIGIISDPLSIPVFRKQKKARRVD